MVAKLTAAQPKFQHPRHRPGGSNLQDEYSNIGGLHDIAYLKSELDAPIYWRCAVRVKNNILSPLCLFNEIMPSNKAVASGNGCRFLTQKLHAQIS
jgi:hypothetical protein